VNVILLQVFVSLMLVAGSVLLFAVSIRYRDHEHADRLSLIPLEDDSAPGPSSTPPSQSDSKR
jgi:hypothetical protein